MRDIYLEQNLNKSFIAKTKQVSKYIGFEAVVLYNTAADPTASSSNVFLRYSYTSNYPSINSQRYPNNYFQFQLGYNLDITKIFAAPK